MQRGIVILLALLILPGWGCQASRDVVVTPSAEGPRAELPAGRPEQGPRVELPAVAPVGDALPPPKTADPWAVEFLLGAPLGVRLQRDVLTNEDQALVVEGFAGVEVLFPEVGGGIRYRVPLRLGGRDALVIAPGVDAYLLANPFHGGGRGYLSGGTAAAGLYTLDTDLMWQHTFRLHTEGDFGIKLGAGVAEGNTWVVIPVVSVLCGWRF
jgi:hypothetical protein